MERGERRILFEASVGYGKSKVILFLASSYSRTGRRVWVLSNRSAVVHQLADATSGLADVTVITVQAADRDRAVLAVRPSRIAWLLEA